MKFEIFTPTVIHELGQRKNQEDSVFPAKGAATETDRLFLVCDGMGGHAKGEVASANVIEAMTTWIKQRTLPDGRVTDGIIESALLSAHQRLDTLDDGAANKMGTTLTIVCLHSGGVSMGHVGDSRIYHIRPSQKKILYKSIDHSLVYSLYLQGVISYEEMATSPQRNVITRAIMPGEENNDIIDIAHTSDVQPGDYFYLCSDGMLEDMTDAQLVEVLSSDASDVIKANTLVTMTASNKDNHTALLIKIKNVIAEPGDENLHNDEHISPYNEVAAAPIVPELDNSTPVMHVPPAAPANNKAANQNKQTNSNKKLLLLLAILLLALVIGGALYFLLNKDKSSRSYDDESDDITTEKVEGNDKNDQSDLNENEDYEIMENNQYDNKSPQQNNNQQPQKTAAKKPTPKTNNGTPQQEKPQINKKMVNEPNNSPQQDKDAPCKDGLNLNEKIKSSSNQNSNDQKQTPKVGEKNSNKQLPNLKQQE
jgi:protein phosphatase